MASDPHNLSYSIYVTAWHIQRDQWDEVARILDMLESDRPWSGFGSRYVSWIRKQYEGHLKASGVNVQ